MKHKVYLGNFADNCKLEYKDKIPVTINFNHDQMIGEAKLVREDKDLMAEIQTPFVLSTSSRILERQGNEITKFEIQSVSFIVK